MAKEVTRSDLRKAARELNKVLGLEPSIDTNADDLESQVKEASGELKFPKDEGKLSESVETTLRALGINIPQEEEDEEEEEEEDEEEEEEGDEGEDNEDEPEQGKEKKVSTKSKKKVPAKGKAKGKATTSKRGPSAPKEKKERVAAEKGYKGHRAGSKKEEAHRLTDKFPKKGDIKELFDLIEALGVKRSTARAWVGSFRKEA